ncbi:hypothetical protein ABTZ59_20805 [Streptomyces sp. NPDC094034]|uniref:hypothetical protein n=1 Tax=Streptomyces sp. NPDC094034 TaxID=3155309 RepID=UPI0033332513
MINDVSHQTGGLAQRLVAGGLLRRVGEEVAQVGTGVAEPFGLGGVAEYGLRRCEGDQFGIAQAGVMPTDGRHGAGSGCFFSMSSVA